MAAELGAMMQPCDCHSDKFDKFDREDIENILSGTGDSIVSGTGGSKRREDIEDMVSGTGGSKRK
ncbi:hypothetical protein A2U01_0012145, partial [Trifolium medium]|nr:hypothetical protein [Trifolium medium]